MASLGFKPTAKLIILPLNDLGTVSGAPFVAMYNPTSLSVARSIEMVEKNTTAPVNGQSQPVPSGNTNSTVSGTTTTELKKLNNPTFNVELFFDGTGASPALGIPSLGNLGPVGAAVGKAAGAAISAVGVDLQIGLLMSILFSTSSTTHTQRTVKLIWGAGFLMKARATSATTNYTLINRLGLPLRATVSLSFTATEDSKKFTALLSKFQSPDITKTRVVKAGDTIYNIAKEEYDSESFYLQIAEANDLKNYRRLVPGQVLILPPVNQVEEE